MRRLLEMPVGRALTIGAAVMFGAFFIAAAVATAAAGRDGASVVAGVMAYAYLAFAAVVVGRHLLRRPKGAERAVRTYLSRQPAMGSHIGEPVQVTLPRLPAADGPGQANISVEVSGPLGTGTVEMSIARLGREWEVLQAILVTDGTRVPLAPAGR
jgi:hypothetical protein